MQFNSCPNLLSNYANEFIVGGSPSRLSGDLDSLGKGQKVSLTCVRLCERSVRKRGGKQQDLSGNIQKKLVIVCFIDAIGKLLLTESHLKGRRVDINKIFKINTFH